MKSGWVVRPGAAEFPHENALLDRGALWIGTALCGAEIDAAASKPSKPRLFGRVKALAPPMRTEPASLPDTVVPPSSVEPKTADRDSAMSPDRAEASVTNVETPLPVARAQAPVANVETPAALATRVEEAAERVETDDERVEMFVRAVAEVARAHGPAETAAHAESLFKFGTPAPLDLSPSAREALLDGNILEATDGGDHATAWFARTSSAWQSMLRGEGGNLAAECGESTLDGWTADLIARLVAKPSLASAIRRDLRRRGIAAFGMLDS